MQNKCCKQECKHSNILHRSIRKSKLNHLTKINFVLWKVKIEFINRWSVQLNWEKSRNKLLTNVWKDTSWKKMLLKNLMNSQLLHCPNNSNASLMSLVMCQKQMVWKNSGPKANHNCNCILTTGKDAIILKTKSLDFCKYSHWSIFKENT